jgi:hypothetical protein
MALKFEGTRAELIRHLREQAADFRKRADEVRPKTSKEHFTGQAEGLDYSVWILTSWTETPNGNGQPAREPGMPAGART